MALNNDAARVQQQLETLYTEWVPDDFDFARVTEWACERIGTPLFEMTPDALKKGMQRRVDELKTLYESICQHGEINESGEVRDKLTRIAKVMRETRNHIQTTAILYRHIDENARMSIPTSWNPDSFFQFIEEDDKANSFQKLLMHLLRKMSVDNLRKLDDHCYRQVVVPETGEPSHAWEPYMSIKEYIYTVAVNKETDYVEWKNMTNPHDNGERVGAYLARACEAELPELVMNRFLWAYKNGLYNVRDDMFFPFKSQQLRCDADITPEAVRRLPTCADTLEEAQAARPCRTVGGVFVFSLGDEIDIDTIFWYDGAMHQNFLGREAWPELARRITIFRRGMHIGSLVEVHPASVRLLPELEPVSQPTRSRCVQQNGVRAWHIGRAGKLTRNTVFEVVGEEGVYYSNNNGQPAWRNEQDQTPYLAEVPTGNDVAVKFMNVPFRFEITPEAEVDFDPHSIVLPEMQRIMAAQDLTDDTQMWLIAMLCRLFFPVGYDRWQVVLFIKGIAGSGKSTLAQIIRYFYPPTKVSTLASNIEQKFGLSAIYKGLVCVCAEVREDFGLDQADWQSAVSGEEVQIAIKNKTAFPHKWDTPMFFLGNELPNYRNNSGSVVRRFFMVEFRKKVRANASDPHLFDKFVANIDQFQRKGVALYHMLLQKYGENDIWAQNVVGPQLNEFVLHMKKQTDVLFDFCNSPAFVVHQEAFMPMVDFQKAYMEYRRQNGMDKVSWKADHYNAVFSDMGLHIATDKRSYNGQNIKRNHLVGIDVRREDEI